MTTESRHGAFAPSFAFAHCPPPVFQLPHFRLLALNPSLHTLRLFFVSSSRALLLLSRPSRTSRICCPHDFGCAVLVLSPFVAAQSFITLVAFHLAHPNCCSDPRCSRPCLLLSCFILSFARWGVPPFSVGVSAWLVGCVPVFLPCCLLSKIIAAQVCDKFSERRTVCGHVSHCCSLLSKLLISPRRRPHLASPNSSCSPAESFLLLFGISEVAGLQVVVGFSARGC